MIQYFKKFKKINRTTNNKNLLRIWYNWFQINLDIHIHSFVKLWWPFQSFSINLLYFFSRYSFINIDQNRSYFVDKIYLPSSYIYQIDVKQFYFRDIKYHSYCQNEVSPNMEYYVGGQNPVYPFREFGLIHSNREEHCNYCERNFNALINPLLIEIMKKEKKWNVHGIQKLERLTATNMRRIPNKPMHPIEKRSSWCSWMRSCSCHKWLNKN